MKRFYNTSDTKLVLVHKTESTISIWVSGNLEKLYNFVEVQKNIVLEKLLKPQNMIDYNSVKVHMHIESIQ